MAVAIYTNNATATLSSSITAASTSFTVTSGQGALFPSTASGNYFYVTLIDTVGTVEIVKVTAKTTDTFTIVRAQDGTTASAFASGSKVELRIVAAGMNEKLASTDGVGNNLTINNSTFSGGTISGAAISANSPAFTGTPTAPTAAYGTNNTQIANTAFVQAALKAVYPVGSVYINAAVTTNPATLLGFGTWVEIGAGRVLVGQNAADAAFDTLGETGGSKDATLVSHQHGVSGSTSWAALSGSVDFASGGIPNYSTSGIISQFGTANQGQFGSGIVPGGFTVDASHSHSVSGATDWQGSSAANANLQPYIVVKMWQRTA